MAPDFSAAAPVSSPAPPAEIEAEASAAAPRGAKDKVRLRFRKDGALRWLSHHDLLRTFERILRRSELPFRSTQGFNPHPRIVFALSLPLGVVGRSEVVEIELDESIDPEELRRRLQAQCPEGLAILEACRIAPNAGVHVRGLCYGVAIPAERIAEVRQRIALVLAGGPCWVERSKPTPRRLDIRPFLRDLRLDCKEPLPPAPSPMRRGGEAEEPLPPAPSPMRRGGEAEEPLPPAPSPMRRGGEAEEPLPPAPSPMRRGGEETSGSPLRCGEGLIHSPSNFLEIDLWLLPTGTARPDEVLGVLGLADLLADGAVLERVRLEMEDENPTTPEIRD